MRELRLRSTCNTAVWECVSRVRGPPGNEAREPFVCIGQLPRRLLLLLLLSRCRRCATPAAACARANAPATAVVAATTAGLGGEEVFHDDVLLLQLDQRALQRSPVAALQVVGRPGSGIGVERAVVISASVGQSQLVGGAMVAGVIAHGPNRVMQTKHQIAFANMPLGMRT
jgi:hypothetical protein